MFNKTIGQDFNLGFPGTPSRSIDDIIASFPMDTTIPFMDFGTPVVLNANKEQVKPFAAGSVAADFIGFAVRNVRSNKTYMDNDHGYRPVDEVDVQTRGRMSVLVAGNVSPVKTGQVYALPDGTVTADSAAAGAVALPDVIFAHNGKDINNVTEITMLKRNY